jgi:hypothetical protein
VKLPAPLVSAFRRELALGFRHAGGGNAVKMPRMPALEFPRNHLGSLQELAVRLIDSRKPGTPHDVLARDLLAGFYDISIRSGLDRVIDELATAHPPLDPADRGDLAEHPTLNPALAAQLATLGLDKGGPRGEKPRQLADAVVTALGLTLTEEADRTITLGDDVRRKVVAAMASVVDDVLGLPKIRETMIAESRKRLELRHQSAFDKIAPRLDDRGMKMISQPKVPIDAVQAAQRALLETRTAVLGRAAGAAIDRARDVIAAADPEAAARIDQPVTHRLTPRDVAIRRACEPRVPAMPEAVVQAILESVTELARLAWRSAEKPVRPYKASETFAIGDVVEHPTFGRGSVIGGKDRRIDVEFADGARTLVHVPPK